jgi:hypothetical protein
VSCPINNVAFVRPWPDQLANARARQHKAQPWSVPRLRGRGEQAKDRADSPLCRALGCEEIEVLT